MKHMSKDEFRNLLKTKVAPLVEELERVRREILFFAAIALFFTLTLNAGIYVFDSDFYMDHFYFIIPISLILMLISIIFFSSGFERRFKHELVKQIIEKAFPGYEYNPEGGLSSTEFNNTKMFSTESNDFMSEDRISGQVGKNKFFMCEVYAFYESGTGKNRSSSTIFEGFVIRIDFDKPFKHRTIIKPDFAEKFFGKFFGAALQDMSALMTGMNLVKFENTAFEKTYVVYSENQKESRSLITPKFMQNVIKSQSLLKSPPHMSFYKNNLYIALKKKENYFEANIFKSLFSIEQFIKIYDAIDFIDDLVEELELNTQIWTEK